MKLENRYIVIKRDKLSRAFEAVRSDMQEDGELQPFDPVSFIDSVELEEFLDRMMRYLEHDYFVMNLDEPAAQDAMERYFHYHDADTVPKV